MKHRKISVIIYIIGILFLLGCAKTVTVKTNVVPKSSGQVIVEGEYEVGTTFNLQAHSNKGSIFIDREENDKIIAE